MSANNPKGSDGMQLDDRKTISISQEFVPLFFETPIEVLKHLKKTGVNGLNENPLSPSQVVSFCKDYKKQYMSENGLILTYHPIYIIARKKRRI